MEQMHLMYGLDQMGIQVSGRIIILYNVISSNQGVYTVTVTKEQCTTSGLITLTVKPKPSAPIITGGGDICNGSAVTLVANGCPSGNVIWSNNSIGNSITVTKTGAYYAICKVGNCSSEASNIVSINTGTRPTPPTISANKTTLCDGEFGTITATNCNGVVKWSNGATTTVINVVSAGTYTATCTNGCGTSDASNPIVIVTSTKPVAPVISASKTQPCSSELVTLTASGCNGNVVWNNGSAGTQIPGGVGIYSARCVNICGTSEASNIIVISPSLPPTPPIIIANKTQICGSELATLTAVNCNGTVTWNNGTTGTQISVGAGTYSARCIGSCGTSVASNEIIISSSPVTSAPTITSNKTVVCGSELATLTAVNCNVQ